MSHAVEKRSEQQRRHAARMFAWEDEVADDVGLVDWPHATQIVVILRKKMRPNAKGVVEANVDHKWLARKIGKSISCVQRTLAALARCGHLEKDSGRSRGKENTFRPKLLKEVSHTRPTSASGSVEGDLGGRASVTGQVGRACPTRSSSFISSNSGGILKRFNRNVSAARPRRSDDGQIQKDIAARLGAEGWETLFALEQTEVDQMTVKVP